MREKYYHYKSACKNPSAFASQYYIQGYSGRFGEVRAACEAYIHDITQNAIITTKTIKNRSGVYEITSITFKEGFVKPEPIEPR